MRLMSAGTSVGNARGSGLIWNTSAPTFSVSPCNAGWMNSCTARSLFKNAALGAMPRPSSARTKASHTRAGALTTKRNPGGTCAAYFAYWLAVRGR